ncbi:hypothetical protein VZ169_19255 [Acinetobacter baumannii]|uniref:hypothetical protein n=1 Tax=Acinetobacter baumannii TaxID=470 RepID=UPI002E2B8CE8|nr:hypothetical protein [Acinetobacter baumannii]MED6088810.1 hypothetical protein [Acinetobacter baumannii]
MDNSKRPINQIIARINDAAKHGEALVLTAEEVKILSKDIGDKVFIPVLTNEQVCFKYYSFNLSRETK